MGTDLTGQAKRLTSAVAERYRVEREVGAGGMATVYLAEDRRHHRKVAIKVLHPELSAVLGTERFLREIELTAGLQHPHILPLFDSGEADGLLYYVMPYVEGETLRATLERDRQLPVHDAVRIATEVAAALDYAHRRSVVHRDIKPENVLLQDGHALVADFGIALAVEEAAGQRITQSGLSLGTPQYMAPEQAMGQRTIDARADVYALGAVLYEMLAGEPPFTGPTAQAIVAKVVTETPRPLAPQRRSVPPALDAVIARALEKLPADRWATAKEFGEALGRSQTAPRETGTGSDLPGVVSIRRPAPRWLAAAGWVAAAVATVAAIVGWQRARARPAGPTATRLAMMIPVLGGSGGTNAMRQLAFTPAGDALVFVAIAPDGTNRVMRQSLDAEAPTPIPVPHGIANIRIAPDGRSFLGSMFGDTRMRRFPIEGGGGEVVPIDRPNPSFMAFGEDGTIWFTPAADGVARLRPGATKPDTLVSESHRVQDVLPGDRSLLALRSQIGTASGPLMLVDARSGEATTLISEPVVEARYTDGHLVFVRPDGTMHAAAFDAGRGVLTGAPVQIATNVSITGTGIAQIAVAPNGLVGYIPEEPRSLVFVDRTGAVRPASVELHNYHAPKFSPDGRRLSVDLTSGDGRDVWILSLDQGTLTRATFDRDGHDAEWTPDGRYLIYSSSKSGVIGIYRKRPTGADPADSLLAIRDIAYTGAWLPGRNELITVAGNLRGRSGNDIARVGNGGRGPVEPVVATDFVDAYPSVSPDGRWLAYMSNFSGQSQVYVRPLDGNGDQVQVSLSGGTEPEWSPDGRELFYRSLGEGGGQFMVATVRPGGQFEVTSRRALFPIGDLLGTTPHSNYDVSPDGRTFVMVRRSPATRIMVIQNLRELVRRIQGRRDAAR